MPHNLQKFEEILKLLNEGLSRDEFAKSFGAMVKQILRLEKDLLERHHKTMSMVKGELLDDLEQIKKGKNAELEQLKKQAVKELDTLFKEQEKTLKRVEERIANIHDGVDAYTPIKGKDYFDGVSGVDGKNGSPDTGEEIRNKLEALQDENRLSMQAIAGLEEILDELKQRPIGGRGGGGGFSKIHMDGHIIDDETPAGAISGVNVVFTLANTPVPAGSLKVYVGGQRMRLTDDYTISNRTITFNTAPPYGAVVLVDYRI